MLSGLGPHQHPLPTPSHRPTAGRRHRWQARMRPPARLTQLSRWRAPCISSSSCLEQLGASQPGPSCSLSLAQGSCQPTLRRPLSLVEENTDSLHIRAGQDLRGHRVPHHLLQMGKLGPEKPRGLPRSQRTKQRGGASSLPVKLGIWGHPTGEGCRLHYPLPTELQPGQFCLS